MSASHFLTFFRLKILVKMVACLFIHIVIQELVTGFVGILTFAAGCIELVFAQALLRQRLRLLHI